jgi:hypothetical protein
MPAYGRKKDCNSDGLRPVIKLVIFLQGCRARLPGKAAGQGCRARLPGRVRLLVNARVHAMVQYAESMLKLDNNAVF